MLVSTPGWARRARNDAVMLESPLGVVVFRDEQSPIVAAAQWNDVGGPIDRVVTREGEYAGLARDGARLCAVVLGDRHYARLDGKATDVDRADEFAAAFRELVRRVSFGLGVRRRRLWYAPPPQWLAVPRGLITDWVAPGAPRGATQIRVYPANPTEAEPEDILTALVGEVVHAGHAVELVDRDELPTGIVVSTRLRSGAAQLWRDWALFRDGGYHCTVRLDSTTAAGQQDARPVFRALLSSIEPLPSPPGPENGDVLSLWAE